jgi:hypothetical protein
MRLPWEGRSGVPGRPLVDPDAVSQKTCLPRVLFRCFGLEHPGRVPPPTREPMPRSPGRSSILLCPTRQKGLLRWLPRSSSVDTAASR